MTKKISNLIPYTRESIQKLPSILGVYFFINKDFNSPYLYVGKAGFRLNSKGNITGGLKERLLEHIENNEWPDVKYFQYMECENEIDMNRKESYAISSFQPKYNRKGKSELVQRLLNSDKYKEYVAQ